MAYGLFGGFAEGLTTGTVLRQKRDALEDEKKTNQLRRDNFELEIRKKRGDLEEADRLRGADAWLQDALEGIESAVVNKSFEGFGFKDFSDFQASRKASQPQPQQPQPERPTGLMGLVDTVRRGIAPAEQAGIAAPGAAPAPQAPAEEQKPKRNLFIPLGAQDPNLYEQRLRLQGQALEKYYTLKNQPEKALAVPATIKNLLKGDWEERLGMSVPMALAGSRPGLRQLSGLNDILPNGFKMDPETGAFDEKTRTWKDVMVLNEKTGEKEPMSVTPEMLIGLTKRYDVAGAAKEIIDYQDKRAAEGRAERSTRTQEGQLEVSRGQLGVSQQNARSNERRAIAQENRTNMIEDRTLRASEDEAAERFARKRFPLAGRTLTMEDEAKFGGDEKKIAKFQAQIDAENDAYSVYSGVVGVNPKVNKNTLAAFAQASANGTFKDQTPKMDGDRRYVVFAGQKIYLD